MGTLIWLVLVTSVLLTLAYRRTDLQTSTIVLGVLLVGYLLFGDGGFLWDTLLLALFVAFALLNVESVRRDNVTRRLFGIYRRMLPSMSKTEQEALEAGNVWWDGELFTGMPDWRRLKSLPAPKLTPEEQAFLDGPTEELCRLLDDWQITHDLADMPPNVWEFIKEKRFFAMIIPQEYGGLQFSPLASSMVLAKLSSRSAVASSTVGVPNSLGPAELLLHYGTDEQKQHWLPRLASGEEVPCFALTSPRVGSDATALVDNGVVCKGTSDDREIIGIRLNWDKRYITLAPIATVLGLAFKLYDPEHLIGDVEDYGITAALIPTDLPGIEIGRRHLPSAFRSRTARRAAATCSSRSIRSSAARRWRAKAGACSCSSSPSAGASCCRATRSAAPRRRSTRPVRTRSCAGNSICRSASFTASAKRSRAWPAAFTR